MPTDITREQMVRLLKNEQKEQRRIIRATKLRGRTTDADNQFDKKRATKKIAIIDAILAALAEPEPVGEGMKKEMLALIERDIRGARILLPGLDGEDRKSLIREIIVGKAIRNLILGNQGGTVSADGRGRD